MRLNKESQDDKLGLGLVEDVHGQVTVSRIHPGYLADTSNSLLPGDVIVSLNGELVPDLETALKLVGASVGMLELRLVRTHTACTPHAHLHTVSLHAFLHIHKYQERHEAIEELDITITRDERSGRLGFGIDAMNTIVEVDANGPVAGKLEVGDKILAVDSQQLLNYKRFVDAVGPEASHKLRVARLASANLASSQSSKGKREKTPAPKFNPFAAADSAIQLLDACANVTCTTSDNIAATVKLVTQEGGPLEQWMAARAAQSEAAAAAAGEGVGVGVGEGEDPATAQPQGESRAEPDPQPGCLRAGWPFSGFF